MRRKIITIDDNKCNGCGVCVPACHEGAIKIVNGKAKLSQDALCDGLGACLGECPQSAITVQEREADDYSEIAALKNISKQGAQAVDAHLKHLQDHGQKEYLAVAMSYLKEKELQMTKEKSSCGCPGAMARDFRGAVKPVGSMAPEAVTSGLEQWPVQLKLLSSQAPFFEGREIVVSADCVPFTYANFHSRFLKGKALVVFCPKLDEGLESYVEKLVEIFKRHATLSVSVVRMEVPCCGGTLKIVEDAVRRSGKNVVIKEYTISLRGEIV
ncbi:MAG: 4Fe-4S binding protein [Candidatus Omnitrophica bacterium]|nr:4Fe-4S binding protein [Candidatus Omnitrophota bacterium]